jgi:hypothetical protein
MKPLEKSFWEEAGELVHLEGNALKSAAPDALRSLIAESLQRLLAHIALQSKRTHTALAKPSGFLKFPLREKKNEPAMALFQEGSADHSPDRLRPGSGCLLLAVWPEDHRFKNPILRHHCKLGSRTQRRAPRFDGTLNKLHQAEKRAESDFQRLTAQCDVLAATDETGDDSKARKLTKKRDLSRPWRLVILIET